MELREELEKIIKESFQNLPVYIAKETRIALIDSIINLLADQGYGKMVACDDYRVGCANTPECDPDHKYDCNEDGCYFQPIERVK
jgi:hypothetical protein